MSRPTDKQMWDKIDQALEAQQGKDKWPGMTYAEGVEAALRWALDGDSVADPMEE